tara:strand:- start:173 stop:277 length:105 start_codon:yes stop_codon:yes gene_type:complete
VTIRFDWRLFLYKLLTTKKQKAFANLKKRRFDPN